MDNLLNQLQAICGEGRVTSELVDRLCYRRDCGPGLGGTPAYVVRPQNVNQLVEIVKLANQVKRPLFLWGRATTFVDSGVPESSIVIALDLLNQFEIDLENQIVTAECGVIWHALDSELKKLGWELTAPGGGGLFSSSVGGTIAYNAVPHAMTEYGITGEHVVSLEVVLPDGTLIRTGSAANNAAGNLPIERGANGPDLAGLFIGSCGTLGIITRATLRIRRIPESEQFLFYAFDRLGEIVDAVSAIQSQQAATFLVGLFGGPKPANISGNYFLHIIIRDNTLNASRRYQTCKAICESFKGRAQDANATQRYWSGHMYSWLRNAPPEVYYGSRPYYCPEVAGFIPTQSLKDAIPLLEQYIREHQSEWQQHGILLKGLDVYFSRNAAFLWVDTLYPESNPVSHRYGFKIREDISELLFNRWMSPGGIVAGIAPYIMNKLGSTYRLMQSLKDALDPNHILNPGVLMLGGKTKQNPVLEQVSGRGEGLNEISESLYQCLRCGFCLDVSWVGNYHKCPSYLHGTFETYSARGRITVARAILEGEIDYDEKVADRIYSCTLCGACSEDCLKNVRVNGIYLALRQDMASRGLIPKGLRTAAEATYRNHNPYDKPDAIRFQWLGDQTHFDRKSRTAFFAGCTPSYVRRSMAREAIELLNKLELDYTIASKEWCCGHPLMVTGKQNEAAELLHHNIENYKQLGVERIVFSCPACYESFKCDAPKLLGEPLPFETLHLVELLAEKINSGQVEFNVLSAGSVVTYHDPCVLGRHLQIYDAPRTIINAIPGMRLVEMPRNHGDAFCCGSGAFVRLDYPKLAESAGLERWSEAQNTGAGILLTACPACLTQFMQLRGQTDPHRKEMTILEVMDITNLANRLIRVKQRPYIM